MLTYKQVVLSKMCIVSHRVAFQKCSEYMQAAGQHFEKLNDRQFEIHIHMHTGDLLALNFVCHSATSDS